MPSLPAIGPGRPPVGASTSRTRVMPVLTLVPVASLLVKVMKKRPFAGVVGLMVLVVGGMMNSNSPAPGGLLMLALEVSTTPRAGIAPTTIVDLVMQPIFGSPVPRTRFTPLTAMSELFLTTTDMRATSPASANASWSPLRSCTFVPRTTSCGSGTFLQEMAVLKVTASSGMPLLSSSRVWGGSQASPRPSWSVSSCLKVPGIIGGFGTFGQVSTLSGPPSPSASSCTAPHEPSFTSPSFWQVWVTGALRSHVPWLPVQRVLSEQANVGAPLQWPTAGQSPFVAHCCSLIRLHEPVARVAGRGFRQSPSQTSPTPSWSVSVWAVFAVRTQLSRRSWIVSPSRSPEPEQAFPRVPAAPDGIWTGL